ncbi:family 43 glycosylhydrolase [Streptomyces chartreusis]|uniref:family 43 glycosylhydrolase n=1 Tax=Streptomyces chartreusis TaxID=1969 RepID=UPI00367A58AB
MEADADDPARPYHFKAKLTPPNHSNDFAIDPGILQHNGRLYLAYSGINAYRRNGLNIAPISNPYRSPATPWRATAPEAAPRSGSAPNSCAMGRIWMTYSTCDTGKPDHRVWMMSLPSGADPLVPGKWQQHSGRVFSPNDAREVFRSRPPRLLPFPRRNRGLGDLPCQDHPGLHLLQPHHPRAEVRLARRRQPGPRHSAHSGCHPEPPLGRPRFGQPHRQRHRGIRIDEGAEQRVDFYGAIRTGESLQYLSPGWRTARTLIR